ncbi:hypothetical protein CH306_07205 [Rhodococcus sp. 15-725-2-2b]|jgi:hypothetical protein|uniref:hypothetical protein n=1 Tax=Nocardiaceae TaxID=85025 RepID=UPI00050C5205|nr:MULTISPECIES: hypothetical protein [Rhodococcus]AJW41404.1 membrane protein [Rhodococcus sp. B7740]OZC65714.1 hypothetical protein CH276_11030 [Rhodococcus sp. 06-470-2]OZC69544.1 hypothetical protein CH277_10590 [Rhodococcus sp. 06-469-3-2]OZC77877.1 hypothetical protein CH274_17970 [Rhodococcus sp. 06-418-5]OZD45444.1 hypothetical protein CH264_14055 [Rhodococcus sp. 06-1477-1A]
MPDNLQQATRTGFGRFLIAVYAVFAVAATSRSIVQLTTRFDDAPVAYLLSAFAAVVYIVATVGLARATEASRRVVTVSCIIELVGVIGIGTLSYIQPQDFPEPTVWSHFGSGYVFIPVVLPIAGLWWLRKTRQL